MKKINKKAIISSTIKNEEKNLPNLFNNFLEIKKTFNKCFFIFVISDCVDKSENLIREFLKNNQGKLIVKNFKKKTLRLKKLEISRNLYIDYIKKSNSLKKYDFLIVIDAGKVNDLITSLKIFKSIKNIKKEWTAIFANQIFFYYDLFALRLQKVFDFDCFRRLILEKKKKKNLPKFFKKIIFDNYFLINNFRRRYISVKSAFGGFGIYKLNKIIKYKYSSKNGLTCEHVFINEKLYKKNKNLYIDRQLTNSFGINRHVINSFLCSHSNFFLKRFLSKIK